MPTTDRRYVPHFSENHPAAPWEQLPRRQQQLLCRLVIEHPEAGQEPTFSPADVAKWFMVSPNTARAWIREWGEKGLVEPARGRQRVTSWRLVDGYRGLLNAVCSCNPARGITQVPRR